MDVQKGYNAWAAIYDTNKNNTRDLEGQVIRDVLREYHFQTVLELGCGTGKNTFWLAERCVHLVGLDFSKEMLAKAQKKNQYNHVQLQLADIQQEWAVDDGFLDLISCSLTLEHIKNLQAIFAQASRKLKTNGLFYICELHPFKQYLGSKARFEEEDGLVELEVFVHHISEFLDAAQRHGFRLVELKEWSDKEQKENPPRLVSFVFESSEST